MFVRRVGECAEPGEMGGGEERRGRVPGERSSEGRAYMSAPEVWKSEERQAAGLRGGEDGETSRLVAPLTNVRP